MKKHKLYRHLVPTFFAMLLVIMVACEKDLFNPKNINTEGWNPMFAVPLASSQLTIKDLIPNNETTEDFINIDSTTGAISIHYRGDIFNITAGDVINIPDQNNESEVSFDLDSVPATGFEQELLVEKEDSIHYFFEAGDSIQAHSVSFSGGTMFFSIGTDANFDMDITATITSLTSNSVPAELVFNISGDGTYNTYTSEINLADYMVDMTLGAKGYNEIIIEYDYAFNLVVPGTGRPAETVNFDVTQGFTNVAFAEIRGDLGNQKYELAMDSIEISLFENTVGTAEFGEFEITEPAININVTNSFGLPVALNVLDLSVYEPESGTTTQLNLQSSSFNINAPQNVGDEVESVIPITGDNSNLSEVLTPSNKVITYQFEGELNPNGQVSTNFITPESSIGVQAEIELPLEVGIKRWSLQDTIDFSVGTIEQLSEAQLRIILENGFPFEVDFQVFLLDSSNVLIDSLLKSQTSLLVAAMVDNEGEVIAKSTSTTDIGLSSESLSSLGKTKKLVIRAGLSTSNNGQIVKIYDHYELGVLMGMKVGVDGSNLLE